MQLIGTISSILILFWKGLLELTISLNFKFQRSFRIVVNRQSIHLMINWIKTLNMKYNQFLTTFLGLKSFVEILTYRISPQESLTAYR